MKAMKGRCAQWLFQIGLVGLLLLVAQGAVAQGMRVRLGVSGMV
jgi:hypothetical protein